MDYAASAYIADILLVCLAFVYLFAASVFDIRDREIPDWLSFSFIGIALGLRMIYSLMSGAWAFFVLGLAWSIAAFGFGAFLYYARQWGGGDAKLIAGIGASLGTAPFFAGGALPFLVVFLLNVLAVGAVYGLFWAFFLAIRNYKRVAKEFMSVVKSRAVYYNIAFFVLIVLIPVLFFVEGYLRIIAWLSVLLVFVGTFFYAFMISVEKSAMIKHVIPKDLVEGDWVAETVEANGKILCSPRDAGVTKDQINLMVKNKIKKVRIKEGIPFAPSFFLALVLTLIIKDALLLRILLG